MIVKLLTEHHLEFLSLKGGGIVLSESTHVKMPHCWKSNALAHFIIYRYLIFTGRGLAVNVHYSHLGKARWNQGDQGTHSLHILIL